MLRWTSLALLLAGVVRAFIQQTEGLGHSGNIVSVQRRNSLLLSEMMRYHTWPYQMLSPFYKGLHYLYNISTINLLLML